MSPQNKKGENRQFRVDRCKTYAFITGILSCHFVISELEVALGMTAPLEVRGRGKVCNARFFYLQSYKLLRNPLVDFCLHVIGQNTTQILRKAGKVRM